MIQKLSDFLAKLFIKNYQAIQLPLVRSRYGILEGLLSIIVNSILGIVKIILAIYSGSIALLADAIHALSDMVTSFIIVISFVIGKKPSDREHPFGHGRVEQIAALIIAVLISVSGFELIKSSVNRIIEPLPVKLSSMIIMILILTIFIKELLGRISKYYGTKIQSMALDTESWHHRTDAISSVIVIFALVASYYGLIAADGVIGTFIGLFIIYLGIDIAKRTGSQLLGTRPTAELFSKVETLAKGTDNVLAIHDMICHEYGPRKVISFHLEVPSHLKLSEAHTIAEKIEDKIRDKLQIKATVHLDPVVSTFKYKQEIMIQLSNIIRETTELFDIGEMRLIGEETYATLVLDILVAENLSETQIEELTKKIKNIFLDNIPEIHDIRINFIFESGGDSDKHLT